jgi:4-oxalocrotonate tautomerase
VASLDFEEKAMPFVRIDLPPVITAEQATSISEAVHSALVETFAVPPDDRFQVLARHPQGLLVVTPEYLGVRHSPQAFHIEIHCAPGRTLQQKRALYASIAARVQAASGIAPADVIIHLVETLRENWSFGDGVAHYTL